MIRRKYMIHRNGRRRILMIITTSIVHSRNAKHDNKKRHMHTQTNAKNPKRTWGNTVNNNDDKDTDDDNDKKQPQKEEYEEREEEREEEVEE